MAAEGAEVVRTLLAGSMEKVRNATIDVSQNLYERIHSWTLRRCCSSVSVSMLLIYSVTVFRGGLERCRRCCRPRSAS